MRRAARHDGLFPWLITVDELAGCIDYVRSQPELEGRTRPFDIVMPVASPQVDEEHRPLEDGSGRATLPKGTQAMIDAVGRLEEIGRSEEHTSELQSLMRSSYAVFGLKKK